MSSSDIKAAIEASLITYEDDERLQKAIKASLETKQPLSDLEKAIQASLEEPQPIPEDEDGLFRAIKLSLAPPQLPPTVPLKMGPFGTVDLGAAGNNLCLALCLLWFKTGCRPELDTKGLREEPFSSIIEMNGGPIDQRRQPFEELALVAFSFRLSLQIVVHFVSHKNDGSPFIYEKQVFGIPTDETVHLTLYKGHYTYGEPKW